MAVLVNTHSINTLKWLDFLEISNSSKYELLDVNFKSTNKYTEKQIEYLKERWISIQDEAFILEDDYESKMFLKKNIDRFILTEKINLIKTQIDLLIWLVNKEEVYRIAEMQNDYDIKVQEAYAMIRKHNPTMQINYFGDIGINIKGLERILGSLINEYNVKYKETEKKIKQETKSIFYNVIQVNRITGLNLNAMTIVVSEWLEAKKIAVEIAGKQQNSLKNE